MFPDFPDLIFPIKSPHRLVDVTTPPRVPVALPAALRESGATPGGSQKNDGDFIDLWGFMRF
jgi:hypothetical protein